MKKLYLTIVMVALFAISPQHSQAQCITCSPGFTIDSVVQEQTLSGILPFNSIIAFDKFDPTVGTLNCVRSSAIVNTTLDMDFVNRDVTSRVTYKMAYTRVTSLTGPGINPTSSTTRLYGPYDLGQADVDPDTAIHIGPDNVFSARNIAQTTSNVIPYLGTGKVNYTYFNNGSFLITTGNDNFGLNVAAVSNVTVRVVYYFCSNAVLKSGIPDFNVKKNNRKVDLRWTTENESPLYKYVIEWSRNGREFSPLAVMGAQGTGNRDYQYGYEPEATLKGRVFYRVKQLDESSKETYTSVKGITIGKDGELNPSIYPNPATNNVTISFPTAQTGSMVIELVNLSGQIVQMRTTKATAIPALQFIINPGFPAGHYWLRVRNTSTGEQATKKLLLRGS
jgi:hypothetical protein